ncbi:hypothetical protein RJD24_15875 [Bacillaceae bacterium IKA-2]|nr:hypothetical protein RJD24_15875 [Bacillaceae bacterium IKA-2]
MAPAPAVTRRKTRYEEAQMMCLEARPQENCMLSYLNQFHNADSAPLSGLMWLVFGVMKFIHLIKKKD